MRARRKLNYGVRPLVRANVKIQTTTDDLRRWQEQFQGRLATLREYVETNDTHGASIWANSLKQAAAHVGSHHFFCGDRRVAALWTGPDGWATQLLKLEVELAFKDNPAARTALVILRPLFIEICQREGITRDEIAVPSSERDPNARNGQPWAPWNTYKQ